MKRVLALSAVFGFAAISLAAQGGQKSSNSDDRINDQVRMKITTDPDVKGGADEVTVHDGVVTIRGRVDTEKGKSKASKLAKKVKGVKSVENELIVGPPK